jgi:hypothetical protein
MTFGIGHFDFWGHTFWHWCGALYGALVATTAICVLVLDVVGVSDIPNIVWTLSFSFFLLIWAERMQTEARRVRAGWIGRPTSLWSTPKSRSGTHEEFVKTCRRGLGVLGWASVPFGALSMLLWSIIWFLDVYASVLHSELRSGLFTVPLHMFVGLAYLAFGAIAINSRHILSAPRTAPGPVVRSTAVSAGQTWSVRHSGE